MGRENWGEEVRREEQKKIATWLRSDEAYDKLTLHGWCGDGDCVACRIADVIESGAYEEKAR